MFRSIQWKMVIIYLLLILLAMELIGAYLLRSLERYYIDTFAEGLYYQAEVLSGLLERYLAESDGGWRQQKGYLDRLVEEFRGQEGVEVLVLDDQGFVVSASGESWLENKRLTRPEISRAYAGGRGEDVRVNTDTGERALYLTVPIFVGEEVRGVVYVIGSLEKRYETLDDIKMILFTATLIALSVTGLLGFAVARTITGPIVELTSRAREMAAGNLNQQIKIHARDEIGQLGRMFNHMAARLRETLAEISSEKSKIEAILQNMTDGIIAIDRRWVIMFANPAAARLLRTEGSDMVGRRLGDVLPEHDLGPHIEEALAGSGPLVKDLVLAGPPRRALLARLVPFRADEGDIKGVVVVLQDVTEQHRLEELRKEFVANVSHELKTPLTTMKSYLETLLDGALENREVALRFLKVVSNETNRMARLVSDLLQLSQIDYDTDRWERGPVDVSSLLEEAALKLSGPAEEKGLRIEVRPAVDLPPAYAARDRLEQVVINLLTNAIEFTPRGGRITLTAQRQGDYVQVTVSDTGIGIPQEDLPRIFERFYRVDKARSRRLGGTGLGLSIAREIVQAHGGSISIESELNKGTRVTFTVPVAPSEAGEDA